MLAVQRSREYNEFDEREEPSRVLKSESQDLSIGGESQNLPAYEMRTTVRLTSR